jgi:hypothetical protein
MKKLVVVTAFALAGFTASATACDWSNREASTAPTVVADCGGTSCKNTETPPPDPTATQQDSSKTVQPADRDKEESWPVFMADCNGGGCK